MSQPRYFPPGSGRPQFLQPEATPVFKVRSDTADPSPRAKAGGEGIEPESLPLGTRTPRVQPEPQAPLGKGNGRDPRVTETVLEAMDQLDALFSEGPVLTFEGTRAQVAERPLQRVPPGSHSGAQGLAPRREASEPPASGDFDQGARPGTRGALAPLVLVAILGASVTLAAGFGIQALKRREAPRSRVLDPFHPVAPTPVEAGYLARAEAGDVTAMQLLALCYRDGLDTPMDAVEADRWSLRAALAAPRVDPQDGSVIP